MTQPTLVAYTRSADFGSGTNRDVASSITWLTGDDIIVIGLTEDSVHSLSTPTVAGLTFSLLDSDASANNGAVYVWKATAASGSSGTVSSSISSSGNKGGVALWQYRNTGGTGTPVKVVGSSAKTYSLTRVAADSHVVGAFVDWAANSDEVYTLSPSADATERYEVYFGSSATFHNVDWTNQGAAGTTSYGFDADLGGAVDMSGFLVEIKGTAGGTTPRMMLMGVG